jgi:DNA-binding transcriptional MerR regulator
MLSISEVARVTGVARHRLAYALQTGAVQEPARLAGRRCFSPEDVERVRQHFAAMDTPAGVRQPRGRGKEAS